MDETPLLKLPYLASAQAQKHVTHNEALRHLDAQVQLSVVSRALSTPPDSPSEGDRYIVAAPGSGAWIDADGAIAAFQDGAWAIYTPQPGWRAWCAEEALLLVYEGAAWTRAVPAPDAPDSAPQFGVNAAADSYNRFTVKSDGLLFSHDDVTPGTGDVRCVMNRAHSEVAASLLFQTNWQGQAEWALSGASAFTLKVSPDGGAFQTVLNADLASGDLSVGRPLAPMTDADTPCGSPTRRWSVIYADQGVVSAGPPPDAEKADVSLSRLSRIGRRLFDAIGVYQSTSPRGDTQFHIGLSSQTVADAYKAEGLAAESWALYVPGDTRSDAPDGLRMDQLLYLLLLAREDDRIAG